MVAAFVYAGAHPIAKITPTGIEYFLTDSMGSVIGKSSSSGASTASIHYDGFGSVTSAVGASSGIDPAVGMEHRFQGMALDSSTGLYFVRARSYDSRTGRFLTRDPLLGSRSTPETYLPYAFGNNNPYIWRDPTGQFGEFAIAVTVGAVLGAIALATLSYVVHYLELGGREQTYNTKDDVAVLRIRGGTVSDQAKVRSALDDIFGTKQGGEVLDSLIGRDTVIVINERNDVSTRPLLGITWIDVNAEKWVLTSEGCVESSLERNLAHELGHLATGTGDVDYMGQEKMKNVMTNENPIVEELGETERTKYPKCQKSSRDGWF
jgi:RHS repeat-associated protein